MIINPVRRTMRSYCGHGGAIRSAGEVRASAPIRALVAVIAALLVVQFMSVAAYAETINAQIISGPSLTPIDDMIGASIAAPDRYVAAALLMGYSPETISGWDDDIKAKLSNEQTGGSFYTFAENSVQNYYDATEHTGIFKTFLDYVGGTFWNMAETLYGNNLWAAVYTSQEFESAARDLAAVLSGDNVGGGGGGSGDTSIPDTLTFTMSDWVGKESYKRIYIDNEYQPLSVTLNCDTTTVKQDFARYAERYPYHYYVLWCNGSYWHRRPTMNVYFSTEELDIRNDDGIYTTSACWIAEAQYEYGYDVGGNGTHDVRLISVTSRANDYSYSANYRFFLLDRPAFCVSNVSGDPVIPPTQWPDEPSAPSPPELPEPGTNPTVTPAPWSPVLNPTFDFDLNITTDPTSSDLIDWVQKIYYELKAFHRDAHDWASDFGGGFTKVVQAVNSASSQLYSQLLVIDTSIHDEGLRIRNYMYQMFHWLKDQLDFQNNSFDDNNIVYWLKRIWSKLGSGDINLRPTDPTTEPENWWDWLVKAIQNFLIGLAATSTELISEIADIASQVMHEFPFSIPWDIAGILAALSTSPITPQFTFVIPAVEGWWSDVQFVIDLSPFDTAAETIRLMEKLLFTGFLIWKSKDLLDFMDVTKWFN